MEKLFDIKNKSLSTEPTNEEIQFICTFIKKQFSEIENLDLLTITEEERQTIFAIINSIKNAVKDLLSPDGGNYHKLLVELNNTIDFEDRLSKIINVLEQFHLVEDKSDEYDANYTISDNLHANHSHKTYELNEYLNKLMLIPPLQVDEFEISTKKKLTLKYLSEYLNHLISKYRSGQIDSSRGLRNQDSLPLVFFLRDTLLLYIGAKRLQAKGLSLDVKAVMVNRSLMQSFTPNEGKNHIYKKLYNSLFQVLDIYKGNFSQKFIDQFKVFFESNVTKNEIQLINFISHYLNEALVNKSKFIAIDTAAHGTMPLLAHIATGRLHSIEMFTSTPWLYEFYSSNIFSTNFPYMRTLESLICQEELFQFAFIANGKIYITETCDPTVLSKAKLEIGFFLNLIDKNITLS